MTYLWSWAAKSILDFQTISNISLQEYSTHVDSSFTKIGAFLSLMFYCHACQVWFTFDLIGNIYVYFKKYNSLITM